MFRQVAERASASWYCVILKRYLRVEVVSEDKFLQNPNNNTFSLVNCWYYLPLVLSIDRLHLPVIYELFCHRGGLYFIISVQKFPFVFCMLT